MPERVDQIDSISINAIRYRTRGPIQRFLASQPTPRMVVGEPGPRAIQNKSAIAWNDWRGGIGIQRMDPTIDGNRSWWSTSNQFQKRHLTLPALTTTTAASGVAGSWEVGALGERNSEIYAAFGTAVRRYNNTTDSWGSTLFTLPANASDSLNVRMGGTEYLVFATGGGYTYYDGTTATDDTQDTQFLVFWDDRLWGIASTGQLWSSGTIGTEELDAQLPRPNGVVTRLFLDRDPTGDIVIFAATREGVYQHRADAQTFQAVEPTFPFHPDGGRGATSWRDVGHISAGLGVYKRLVGEGVVITTMGLDRDHGLPAAYRGSIAQLVPTHNALIAILDATTGPGTLNRHLSAVMSNADVVQPDTGRSGIFAWDGVGWHVLWTSATGTLPITVAHVSNSYNQYRLWWAHNQRVYWQRLPRDIINPDELTNWAYEASSTHETPWFDADETHTDKVAVVVCLDTTNPTTSETVAVRYRLNNDDASGNQTTLGTITASGHTEYLLPNTTTPTGTLYRQIKFVLDLARGTINTNTPDVNRLDLYFVRKEEIRWGTSCTVVIPSEGDFGQSAEQMYDNLITATDSDLMVEVTWRQRDANAAGTVDPYNYYMDIVQFHGQEFSGHDFSGEFRLTMVQR